MSYLLQHLLQLLTRMCRDIIISIVRVVSTLKVDGEDLTWSGVSAIEWGLAEPGIAILVASSLVLRPIVDKLIHPHRLSRTTRKKGDYSKWEQVVNVQPYDRTVDDQMDLTGNKSDAVDSVDAGIRDLQSLSDNLAYPPPVITSSR